MKWDLELCWKNGWIYMFTAHKNKNKMKELSVSRQV